MRKQYKEDAISYWRVTKEWEERKDQYIKDFAYIGEYVGSGKTKLYPGQSHYESIQPLEFVRKAAYFDPNVIAKQRKHKSQFNTVIVIGASMGGTQMLNRDLK